MKFSGRIVATALLYTLLFGNSQVLCTPYLRRVLERTIKSVVFEAKKLARGFRTQTIKFTKAEIDQVFKNGNLVKIRLLCEQLAGKYRMNMGVPQEVKIKLRVLAQYMRNKAKTNKFLFNQNTILQHSCESLIQCLSCIPKPE